MPLTDPKAPSSTGVAGSVSTSSKSMRIIAPITRMDRYVMAEMIVPFIVGVLIFLVLILGHILFQAVDMIMNRGFPLRETSLFLLYKVPAVAVMAFGAGTLIATSLVLNRIARDSEVVAFRIAGVSVYRFLQPILVFAALVTVAAYFINKDLAPNLNHKSEDIMRELLLGRAVPMIDSDRYFRAENYVFYVREVVPETNTLHDVMVYERSPDGDHFPRLILAKRATQEGGAWTLSDCVEYRFDLNGNRREYTNADEIRINLKDAVEQLWGDQRTPVEMPIKDLEEQIALFRRSGMDVHRMEVDYHQKFSMPAAALVMALLAAPLSMRWARAGGLVGLFVAVILVFLYQGIWSWSRALGLGGYIPPFWAAWSQNFIFGGFGLLLLLRER